MLQRALLILVTLAIALPVFSLLLLHWSGLGWGLNIDWLQKVLLPSTLIALLCAIVSALLARKLPVIVSLGLAIAFLSFSMYWAGGAKERKQTAIEENHVARNTASLTNALERLDCDNGDRFVLLKDRHNANGEQRVSMTIELIPPDPSLAPRTLTYSTGQRPPDPNAVPDYFMANPGVNCEGPPGNSLESMFSKVAIHYRQHRPRFFPKDVLYASNQPKTSLGAKPVDPLDLLTRIRTVNEDIRERIENWHSYSFRITEFRYGEGGAIEKEQTEKVEGTNTKVIWHAPHFNFERGEELVDGEIFAYLDHGSNRRSYTYPHVLQVQIRGQLSVEGHQDQGIIAWDEPVNHKGREASRYVFHSTVIRTSEAMQQTYEYVVDRETGLVLLALVTRNGVPAQHHERTILGVNTMDFPDRFSTLKARALEADKKNNKN